MNKAEPKDTAVFPIVGVMDAHQVHTQRRLRTLRASGRWFWLWWNYSRWRNVNRRSY